MYSYVSPVKLDEFETNRMFREELVMSAFLQKCESVWWVWWESEHVTYST